MLSHEKLDVYQLATRFLAFSMQILESLPRGHGAIADQLRRAAISVPLNIAEGAGKTTRADSGKFFSIARGSSLECAAILDALEILKLIPAIQKAEGKNILTRIVAMLSKMCR